MQLLFLAGLIVPVGIDTNLQSVGTRVAPIQADRAEKDSKTILLEAIRAQGGEDQLKKYTSWHSRVKAFHVDQQAKRREIHMDVWFQSPNKLKHVYVFGAGKVIKVYDGEQGWEKSLGEKVVPIEGKALDELRQTCLISRALNLIPLLENKSVLSAPKKVRVKQVDAWAIDYKFEDVNGTLFFDQKNGLLIKREELPIRPDGKRARFEEFFEAYKKFNGVLFPSQRNIYIDNQLLFEMSIVRLVPLSDFKGIFVIPTD